MQKGKKKQKQINIYYGNV